MSTLKTATPADRDRILAYLHPDLGNCLYLYLDIQTYEIGGGTIDVWLQEEDRIVAVLMRYADSFQLYARKDDAAQVNYTQIAQLMNELDIKRISTTKECTDLLKLEESLDAYEASYGTVIELSKYRKMAGGGVVVEEAGVDDLPEIIDLIMMDEELGKSYERESMIRQFASRLEEGTGKNYIIREDGTIVAHLAISAISDEFVIIAYVIVHPEYRDRPLGMFLDSYLSNVVLPEMGGLQAFGFMHDPRRIKLFQVMGNKVLGEYGKLSKD